MSAVIELSNQERIGTKNRFKNMFDLHARFVSLKEKAEKDQKTRHENYIRCYKKHPYLKRDGTYDTNFGIFRQKIDASIAAFKDLVINRNRWANISPVFAESAEQKEDFKQKISNAWHDCFISTWEERSENVKSDLFDMVMFGKGIEVWESLTDVYPVSIPMNRCYPESNAGFNSEKWGLFFYEKKFTVNELLLEIEDEDTAKAKGWNRDALLDFIRKRDAFKSAQETSIIESFHNGSISVDCLELEIWLVFAFVKEHTERTVGSRKGYITHYVMPKDEWNVDASDNEKESRYFKKFEAYAKCMSEVVRVRSYSFSRSYWEATSYAEEILVTCMTVDKTKNRALRNATRKSSIILTSNNTDEQEALAACSLDKEFTVLRPGVNVQQTNIGSDARELMEVTREISFDHERNSGNHLTTGAQNVKGRAITAEEARQNASRESASASNDLDSFADQDSGYLKTLYCKTLDVEIPESNERLTKFRKMFKKRMEEYGIKKEFYDPENVCVESNLAIGAGSPMAKSAIFREIFNVLGFRPSTVGEERAKRDAVAALASEEAAVFYLGPSMETPGNESQHAGNENAILENAEANAMNAQVMGDDNHEVHLKIHLTDAKQNLDQAFEKLKVIKQTPLTLIPVMLDKIHDKIAGAANKMTHSIAHIESLKKDESKNSFVAQMEKEIKQLQSVYVIAESEFKNASSEFMKTQQQNSIADEELRHLQAMNQERERAAKALNDIAIAKAVEKTQFAADQHQTKIQQKEQDHQQGLDLKREEKALDMAGKTLEIAKQNEQPEGQGTIPQQ